VILVDSNIPVYLVGAPHPHKIDAQRLLEKLIRDRQRLTTDAGVLQEILHRYVAIDRRDAIQPAFDALLGVVDEVLPGDDKAVERATDCSGISSLVGSRCSASCDNGKARHRTNSKF
jgi:predicted nucleic acid-binding protein